MTRDYGKPYSGVVIWQPYPAGHTGITIDVPLLNKFWENWDHIKLELIARVDCGYGIYENCKFKEALFEDYLIRAGIP